MWGLSGKAVVVNKVLCPKRRKWNTWGGDIEILSRQSAAANEKPNLFHGWSDKSERTSAWLSELSPVNYGPYKKKAKTGGTI